MIDSPGGGPRGSGAGPPGLSISLPKGFVHVFFSLSFVFVR